MTIYNFPWDGKTLGKAGPYDSDAFTRFLRTIYTPTLQSLDHGVWVLSGNGVQDALDVQESLTPSLILRVFPGAGLVNGRWFYSDDTENVTFVANNDGSGDDRIDLLVLRENRTSQEIELTTVAGIVDPIPVAPAPIRTASLFDIPIAEVTVKNSLSQIFNADIDISVRSLMPRWDPLQGGTGFNGGYTKGDILVATNTDTLVKFPIGNDIEHLVSDSGEASGMKWLDPRITTLWETSVLVNAIFVTTPIAMDSSHDPAGNLLVHASDKWELEPGTYQMVGGGVSFWNLDAVVGGNVFFYLYDFTAAAILVDTDGATVRTVGSPVHIKGDNTSVWLGQEFVIDGTESIGMLGSVNGTGFLTSDIRGGYGASRTIPWSISFKRIK